jgi:hypothetical protein
MVPAVNNRQARAVSMSMLLFLITITLSGQSGYDQFYERSLGTTTTGMYVLGSWAIVNMVSGVYGWISYEGDAKYFNQMNFFWNVVNSGIAGFALHENLVTDTSMMKDDGMINRHLRTEKLLLINSVLDLGYIGAGILLKHHSGTSNKRSSLLKGYGNSIILQGSFLLVFDLIMYGVLRDLRTAFPMDFTTGIEGKRFTTGFRIFF